MSFINWLIDGLPSESAVIDAYFIISDLKDMMPFSSEEEFAHSVGNATGSYKIETSNGKKYNLNNRDDVVRFSEDTGVPIGKMSV